jgi:hypothetical protein
MTLSDPKTSDVGSGPFCLAAASAAPEDQIFDGVNFLNQVDGPKDKKERVFIAALEPQAIRVFSILYEIPQTICGADDQQCINVQKRQMKK